MDGAETEKAREERLLVVSWSGQNIRVKRMKGPGRKVVAD